MAFELVCVICEKDFCSVQGHAKYCSVTCRRKSEAKKWGRSSVTEIAAGTVGAMSEMEVALDMMNKGFAVFRALSPSCLCDLIAFKDGKTLMVEVRTGYKGENDLVSFPIATRD